MVLENSFVLFFVVVGFLVDYVSLFFERERDEDYYSVEQFFYVK